MAAKRARVALLIESSRASGRSLLRGVARYAHACSDWSLFCQERALSDALPKRLRRWRPDGIIARIESSKLARQIRRFGLPAVDILGWHRMKGVPRFGNDRQAIVRMAVNHLRERGLSHFAFCGFAGLRFSEDRARLFQRRAEGVGEVAGILQLGTERNGQLRSISESEGTIDEQVLAAWLRSLPKPVGVLGCNDACARHVLNVCDDCGISVPDEVAVIGVDNDEVLCELSHPTLTSIELNNEAIGYEAAASLDRMLRGESPAVEETRMAPRGIVARRSTETLVVSDPDVVVAVRFIREHACERICVDDVLKHTAMSASTLKRRFAATMGRSPKAEIQRVRLERVKLLLSSTKLPLAGIAELTGFDHIEWMCKLFKREIGRTPGQYRSETQT